MKRCPIDRSIKVVGKKFTLHILRNMILLKQNRFNQFLESIEGISTKTLSIRLRQMEENGLITKTVIRGRPIQTEYSLTEKGKTLEPVLDLLGEFSMKYEPKIIFKDWKQRSNELFRKKYSIVFCI
jgi:DNA-binding HxlR family transcriptional regulator